MTTNAQAPSLGKPFIIAAVVLAGLAVVGFLLVLVLGLNEIISSLIQVRCPSQKEVILDEPGYYTVFHEYNTEWNGSPETTTPEQAASFELSVLGPADQTIPVQPSHLSSTYQFLGRNGRSVAQFRAPVAGSYRISGKYRDQETGEVTFALANGFIEKLFTIIIGGLVALGLPGMLAVICLIIGFVKRGKALIPEPVPANDNLFPPQRLPRR